MSKQMVELTDEEALSFIQWRKHQADWDILVKSGFFDCANGSAEVHFNHLGQIASIDTHIKVFRRMKFQVIHNETAAKPLTEPKSDP